MARVTWPAAYALSCSPDGRLMAAVSRDVVAFDVARGKRAWTAHPLTNPSSATFSGSGSALAVKATSGHIVVLDPATGKILGDHRNMNEGEGSNLACLPGDRFLIDGSWAGDFTVRHMLTGKYLWRDAIRGEMITRITHDRHRRFWVVERKPKILPGKDIPLPGYVSVLEWPFASLRSAQVLNPDRHIQGTTISPDGAVFCFFDQHRNELCVARVGDGTIVASAPLQLGGTGCDCAWSIDGRMIGVVSVDGYSFFATSDLASIGRYSAEYPSSLGFHPDGQRVLLGTWKTSMVQEVRAFCDV